MADYFGYKTVFGLALPTLLSAGVEVFMPEKARRQVHETVFGPTFEAHTDGYTHVPRVFLLGHIVGGAVYLLAYLNQFQRIKANKPLFQEDSATRTRSVYMAFYI